MVVGSAGCRCAHVRWRGVGDRRWSDPPWQRKVSDTGPFPEAAWYFALRRCPRGAKVIVEFGPVVRELRLRMVVGPPLLGGLTESIREVVARPAPAGRRRSLGILHWQLLTSRSRPVSDAPWCVANWARDALAIGCRVAVLLCTSYQDRLRAGVERGFSYLLARCWC